MKWKVLCLFFFGEERYERKEKTENKRKKTRRVKNKESENILETFTKNSTKQNGKQWKDEKQSEYKKIKQYKAIIKAWNKCQNGWWV